MEIPKDQERKSLDLAVDNLNPEQRSTYNDVLMQRRKQLQNEEEGRNVPLGERWSILKGVKSGKIPNKKESPFPGITPGQLDENRENSPVVSGAEKSLPRGDRD